MQEENRSSDVLGRILGLFTKVKPGEAVTVLLMTSNIFLTLAAYYMLKSAREGILSLEPRGAELASYASAFMAILLIPIVRGYGALAERYPRRKLIAVITSIFIINLALFFVLAKIRLPYLGLVYFIWVGIFSNMIIAQFWAYANDIYNPEQGERLFPLIQVGQSVGAILGPLAASFVAKAINVWFLLLVAAAILGGCILLNTWVDSRQVAAGHEGDAQRPAAQPLGNDGGFQLIWKHNYLLYIALLILVLNVVNTTGEYLLRSSVYDAARTAARGAEQSAEAIQQFSVSFYSRFYFWVNLLGLLFQAFLVSRILKVFGVRKALFIPALVALMGYFAIAIVPILAVVRTVKIFDNSQDYSLMNTLRSALYLPTTREIKYKAKQAIDTFFVRLGDVLSALLVAAGIHLFAFGTRGFSAMAVGFVVFWLLLVIAIGREHRRIATTMPKPEPQAAGAAV